MVKKREKNGPHVIFTGIHISFSETFNSKILNNIASQQSKFLQRQTINIKNYPIHLTYILCFSEEDSF